MAPTFRHGKNAVLFFSTSGSTASAIRFSSGFDDSSLSRTVDTAEITAYGDEDKRFLAGLREAEFSFSGNFSSTHEKKVVAMLGNSTGCYVIYSPESTNSGRRKYKFAAIITSEPVNASARNRAKSAG
jgi:hypothetical protein